MLSLCDVSSGDQPTEINVPDVDVSALDDVINYIYTGEFQKISVASERREYILSPTPSEYQDTISGTAMVPVDSQRMTSY